MSKSEKTLEQKADEILALVAGHPGPFMEDDDSFFGAKRVNPSMKDAAMETDCGGAVITKGKMTYGQADEIAAAIELTEVVTFIADQKYRRPMDCHWNKETGQLFHGGMLGIMCDFLIKRRLIPVTDYHNGYEYLYDLLLKRLEAAGHIVSHSDKWGPRRWYDVPKRRREQQ